MAKKWGKVNRFWWEDEEDYYQSKYGDIYDGGADEGFEEFNLEISRENTTSTKHTNYSSGYGNRSWFYKRSYDFSVSLENRVTSLIKTLTGKSLKLASARGWGSDDDYFYYNPEDLNEATDDEVLGRILSVLAKEMYVDNIKLAKAQKKDKPYRHLVQTLEENRALRLQHGVYQGCKYYDTQMWAVKRGADKPKEQNIREDEWGSIEVQEPIPAMNFLFNLNAYNRDDDDYAGTDDLIKSFKLAVSAIEDYLNSPDIESASQYLDEIKLHYPFPNDQEEQQMDDSMGGLNGLSDQDKSNLKRMLLQAEKSSAELDMNEVYNQDVGIGTDEEEGQKAGLGLTNIQVERDRALYNQIVARHLPSIMTLYKLLNSILKDNQAKRFVRPYKRGKIDAKSMYKYLATDNLRIFKQPREISSKKYTMSILVDQSGSMGGQNINNARDSAIILSEVFSKLGLPYEILGFSDDVMNYKKFDASPRKELLVGLGRVVGGTDDYKAIQTVDKHLTEGGYSHNKTGVFVITDGEGQGNTKSLVEKIEQRNTSVFGIGVGGVYLDTLKRTYKNCVQVDNTNQLPKVLGDLIRSQFKRV